MRILIVDDDLTMENKLPPVLRRQGHRVYSLPHAASVPEFVAGEGIDLVICEPALMPFSLALELCHLIRQESTAMIFFVSHLDGITERARALQAGADDYLVKPFDLEELLSRVQALLRRHPLSLFSQSMGMVRLTEELWIDLAGQRLVGDKREVPLTGREFKLLVYLVRHEGAVLNREALLQAVWGSGYEGSTREVDVYIRYLRQKVEPEPSRPLHILSVWGRGYQYKRPATESKEIVGTFQQLPPRNALIAGNF